MNYELTQTKLRTLFFYSSKTGLFIRKITQRGGRANKGAIAGTKNTKGYLCIKIEGVSYKAHRLAWLYVYGDWPINQIDHKDKNKANNKIENLRCVTNKINCQNQKQRATNKSGVMGVIPNKKKGVTTGWSITVGTKYIGYSTDYFEAICMRKVALLEHDYYSSHGAP